MSVVFAGCAPQESARTVGSELVGRAVLTRAAKNPMALAVAPSGDVYFVERTGEVRLYDAERGSVRDALVLEVDTAHENGLLGIALSPEFASAPWVYLHYSAPLVEPVPEGAPPGRNVLARFRVRANGTLDESSREELLAVPSERRCCHEAGSLAFLPDGTLLVSTGDNTEPFQASGAAPLDGRSGRERFDARRTSSNPFDLRGKVLRLAPDGTIPPNNLFPADGTRGRPEIFAMGVRNPFRIATDPVSGRVFFGDIGPDAREDGPYGPRGYDELNVMDAPADFGWPSCIGKNLAYSAVDFATGVVGEAFDCGGKTPAVLAYDYDTDDPAFGNSLGPTGEFVGRALVAGAVYRPAPGAEFGMPRRFEGALVAADWARDRLAAIRVDDAGALVSVERLFENETFHRPVDVEVGDDGALYVLEYGSGFWGDNTDASVSRIEVATGIPLSPIASIATSAASGSAPLDVILSGASSRAIGDGEHIAEYLWDFGDDGVADATGEEVRHRFDAAGAFSVSLRVVSSSGVESLPVAETITVGNAPPSVRILSPVPLGVATAGQPLLLQGEASDAEDGAAACDELVWSVSLGHNAHAHPATTLRGCATSFVPETADHAASPLDLVFLAVELAYTDHGGPNGEAPLTARRGIRVDLVP